MKEELDHRRNAVTDHDKNADAAGKIDFATLPSGKVIVVSRGGFPGLKNTSREIPAETVRTAEEVARRDVFVIHGN